MRIILCYYHYELEARVPKGKSSRHFRIDGCLCKKHNSVFIFSFVFLSSFYFLKNVKTTANEFEKFKKTGEKIFGAE